MFYAADAWPALKDRYIYIEFAFPGSRRATVRALGDLDTFEDVPLYNFEENVSRFSPLSGSGCATAQVRHVHEAVMPWEEWSLAVTNVEDAMNKFQAWRALTDYYIREGHHVSIWVESLEISRGRVHSVYGTFVGPGSNLFENVRIAPAGYPPPEQLLQAGQLFLGKVYEVNPIEYWAVGVSFLKPIVGDHPRHANPKHILRTKPWEY